MAVCLRPNATRGIDHQDRHVAVGCRNRHVARVLLMTGRIGHEHSATIRQIHVTVGHVNRDPLLALGLQSVGEQ
jgi:hypothetical protein